MIPGSVKIYARSTILNPQHVSILIDLSSGIKEHVIHAPHRVENLNAHHMIRKQDKAESSQSKLSNKSVTWITHKAKFKEHMVT
jgi:hypothetical protein